MRKPPERQAPSENAPGDRFETLAGDGRAEIKVKKSRFLAEASPAGTLATAKERVLDITRRHHACRHVCFAWRGGLADQLQESRSDGGEPPGTGGEPILAAIRAAALTDCVVAVARYFGGTKLGTGRLARAYGEAAAAALAAADRRTVRLGRRFTVRFPYHHQKAVSHLLARHGGRILEAEYGQLVSWLVWLPAGNWRAFATALAEATAGEVKMRAPADRPEL